MSSRNIPSEEDFARARAAMRENDRGLSAVRERILERFRNSGVHEAFIFYSAQGDLFMAHIFYDHDRQIEESRNSGLSFRIEAAIRGELENVGRGARDTLKIDVTFDSHENVVANYEGDYYLRLR